jgi:hypothetical protein
MKIKIIQLDIRTTYSRYTKGGSRQDTEDFVIPVVDGVLDSRDASCEGKKERRKEGRRGGEGKL